MFISSSLLDHLTSQAKASPRLRQNYDLRNSETDKSQRMLNAVEPGSIMPIHQPQISLFVERFVRISMMTMEILLRRCFLMLMVQFVPSRLRKDDGIILKVLSLDRFFLRRKMGSGNRMN